MTTGSNQKEIIKGLNDVGVYIDDNSVITQNSLGENGRGASGPEWKPGSDRSQYEKYKYLNVNIEVIVNKPVDIPKAESTDVITTNLYKVVFMRQTGFNLNFKLPLFSKVKSGRRKPKRGITKSQCPVF